MIRKTNWKQWLTAGITAGAVLVGTLALAPQTTFAQASGAEDQPTTQAAAPARGERMPKLGGFGHGSEYQGYLAEALGITVAELEAAQLEAENAVIDQAVTDGEITQEQADLLRARSAFKEFSAAQTTELSYEETLAAAVEAGAITQAQADLLLAQQAEMGSGARGGRGDFQQRGQPPTDQAPTEETPATPEANS